MDRVQETRQSIRLALKDLMGKHGLTQVQVGDVDQAQISRIINNKPLFGSIDTLSRIADAFDLTVDEFVAHGRAILEKTSPPQLDIIPVAAHVQPEQFAPMAAEFLLTGDREEISEVIQPLFRRNQLWAEFLKKRFGWAVGMRSEASPAMG